ncbi:MAG: hypothetical protein ABIN92_07350 [Ferruginibacter sp.]
MSLVVEIPIRRGSTTDIPVTALQPGDTGLANILKGQYMLVVKSIIEI